MSRYRRKAQVIELLEYGPATTGDVRSACECANAAQAYGSLKWLEKCGIVMRERGFPRDHSRGGTKTTTRWLLNRRTPDGGA
jgi:hypothetical protein